MRRLTDFEHIVLGMLCQSPASGYDLKQVFTDTPNAVYQPSSGTLYPALRRLQADGFISSALAPKGQGAARGRRVYRATSRGRKCHDAWVRTPVDPATVTRDFRVHLMRFVMMERILTVDEVVGFLRSLQVALTDYLDSLEHYTATARFTGRHPSIALAHGVAVHRASLDWVADALATLEKRT